MTTEPSTITQSDAIRNLIVCDTQFGWTGETTLQLRELLDLQGRGWLIEGDDNNEFSLTNVGQAVVTRALQQGQATDLQQLERIRDQLHAMSHQAPTNWCDVAACLQADVQKLIDPHRVSTPEAGSHG